MEPENQTTPPVENMPDDISSSTPPVISEPVVDTPAAPSMPVSEPAPAAPAAMPMTPPSMPAAQPAPMMAAPQAAPMSISFNQTSANGEFPEELRKWNWGAFFLNWLWAISNNTYIGLLALVPVVNFYIVIMLGIKGNEWAWKNRKFQSIEHFKKVQKTWAIWGIALFLIGILAFVGIIISGGIALNKSNPKNDATRKANVDQIVKDLNAYGADSRNNGILPFSISGIGKTEPNDPETDFPYDYTSSDSGVKAEVCATLSDATKYCKTAEVTTSDSASATHAPTDTPTATP